VDYLHFESRDVPPYGEPVLSSDLQEGQIYFFLTYEDEELLCPALRPVVFLGRDLDPDVTGMVYFQDLASYLAGERLSPLTQGDTAPRSQGPLSHNEAEVFFGSELETNHVFEFDKALNLLLVCSLRRAARK